MAGQCTTDVASWFAFQAAAGGTDPIPTMDNFEVSWITHMASAVPHRHIAMNPLPTRSLFQCPGWLQGEAKFNQTTHLCQSEADLPQWNPTTQRIPLGPLFPKAREVSKCSLCVCCLRSHKWDRFLARQCSFDKTDRH